jgi:hypothetical protein
VHLQRVQVVLHQGVSQEVQLRAYLHATHLAATLSQVSSSSRARWSTRTSRQQCNGCTWQGYVTCHAAALSVCGCLTEAWSSNLPANAVSRLTCAHLGHESKKGTGMSTVAGHGGCQAHKQRSHMVSQAGGCMQGCCLQAGGCAHGCTAGSVA